MIVIMGASGSTGSALLNRLTTLGVPSRAVTRDPEALRARLDGLPDGAVEIRAADAGDPASLRVAFKGAEQLFLTMANSPAQVALETRIIDIAAESGIGHVVKLSAPAVGPESPVRFSRWHHTIEEHLRASGLAHTVLRPYAFLQKLPHLAPTITAQDVILGAMGDAGCTYIDCRDIADVAAAVLTGSEFAGGSHTLTGDRTYTYPQLAEVFSSLLGRPVRYVDLPPDAMRRNLVEHAGMPDWLAAHVVEIQQLAVTRPETPTDTVARILGRPPRSLTAYLGENLHQFR
ncbi:SDR family oxidoreductase [Longispora sp. NPDC051575]|uniref:SDR family oxidoreductase n=1 Tax=Longispora sp. NPDC051575 TaxID=3154943 RepID=UPI0034382123